MQMHVKNEFWQEKQMIKNKFENELFYCEHILDNIQNPEMIKTFQVNQKTGQGLEYYLKKSAIIEENMHIARTYLVKDKDTHEIVAYFSLKAGMIAANERKSFFRSEFDSVPGIELANFAVNGLYKEAHEEYEGIGKIIFLDFILPIVKKAAKYIGIKYIYIFALPYDHLINYYKTLEFTRLSFLEELFMHRRIRPRYDRRCIFMAQKIGHDD